MLDIVNVFIQKIAVLFMLNPLGQTLGFLAMFVVFLGYLSADDRKTVKIFIIACSIWGIHFFMMGNYSAMWATAIAIVRLVLSLYYRGNTDVFLWVIVVTSVFGIIVYDGTIISTFPVLGSWLATYWFFFLQKLSLRALLFCVSAMWLIYNISTGSIAGSINEIVTLCTIGVSIHKFMYGKHKLDFFKEQIANILRHRPRRADFGRYIFFRDKDRFE